MWFTWARSKTYSPGPARLAPGVRAVWSDMVVSSIETSCPGRGATRSGALQNRDPGAQKTWVPVLGCTVRCAHAAPRPGHETELYAASAFACAFCSTKS